MTQRSLELTAETGITFDAAVISEEALSWARRYNYELVTGLTDTTRKLVQQSVSTFVETPGMTRADLEKLLAPAFGESRASMIGVTEVTRAYSEATNQHQRLIRDEVGLEMRRRWDTLRDSLVCPICGPLNGLPEEDWQVEFPNGPPSHPNCRCSTSLTMDDAETVRAEALAGQTAREKLLREKVEGEKPSERVGRTPVGPDVTTDAMGEWFMEDLRVDLRSEMRRRLFPNYEPPTDWKDADQGQAGAAKQQIIKELAARTGISESDVNRFVAQWAKTSNGNDMRSLAIQQDAAKALGTELSQFTKAQIANTETAFARMGEAVRQLHIEEYGPAGESEYLPLMRSADQQALVSAMRDYTQDQLALAGYGPDDVIRLRRGIRLPRNVAADWQIDDIIPIEGNALESWSISREVAKGFAIDYEMDTIGIVLEMDAPVAMFVGSARTGFGCLGEAELILQGQPSTARVIWRFK